MDRRECFWPGPGLGSAEICQLLISSHAHVNQKDEEGTKRDAKREVMSGTLDHMIMQLPHKNSCLVSFGKAS